VPPAGLRDLKFRECVAAWRHALGAHQKQQQIAAKQGFTNFGVEGLPRLQLRSIDEHLVPPVCFERELQPLADLAVLRRVRDEDAQRRPLFAAGGALAKNNALPITRSAGRGAVMRLRSVHVQRTLPAFHALSSVS
jgi:hypothetical protein